MRLRNHSSWKNSKWKNSKWKSNSWKRKPRRRPWLLIILLLVIGVPIGLEFLARAIVHLAGLDEQLIAQPSDSAKRLQSYRLGFLNPARQPYTTLPNPGNLLAVRSPLLGYQLLPEQKSKFWSINPQGFRDDESVPLQKPAGEVRIFVLGGSAAFGELNSSNQAAFSTKLEALLNAQVADQQATPDRFQPLILPYRADEVAKVLTLPSRIPERQYRVINAAVPGYASGNELAQLMQQVAAYNPDILIELNGYPDLILPSTQAGADIPGLDDALKEKPEKDWRTQATEAVEGWLNQLYLVRGIQHYVLQSEQKEEVPDRSLNLMTTAAGLSLTQTLAPDSTELNRRISRYQGNLLQMARWSAASKKQLLVGIQPEITGKKAVRLTPEESQIVKQLGSDYVKRLPTEYGKLAAAAQETLKASPNAKLLDFYQLYDSFNQQAFQSPTDLTDAANVVLAKRFYDAIAGQLAIVPKPYGSGE